MGGTENARIRGSARALWAARERFLAGEVGVSELDATVRPVIVQSWQRSMAKGVDPEFSGARSSSAVLSAGSLARLRETHPLAPALPIIRRLLVDDAVDSGVVVAVTGGIWPAWTSTLTEHSSWSEHFRRRERPPWCNFWSPECT